MRQCVCRIARHWPPPYETDNGHCTRPHNRRPQDHNCLSWKQTNTIRELISLCRQSHLIWSPKWPDLCWRPFEMIWRTLWQKCPAHLKVKSGISSDLHIFVTFFAKFTFEQKDWSKPIKLSSNRWLGLGTKLVKKAILALKIYTEIGLSATISFINCQFQ